MHIILLLFLSLISFSSFSSEFPDGWRLPTDEELSIELLRSSSPNKYTKAEADFNGDGKTDYAYVLKSTKYVGDGLLVKLSNEAGYEWMVLDENKPGKQGYMEILVMGVSVAKKMSYATACGKGYWDCAKDEPESLTLELPGIKYFMFESASSVFYWNQSKKELDRIWLSD